MSNPYRAANSGAATAEQTMGWTRTKLDRVGRVLEAQTFGGATLPFPWGSSTISTGTVTTTYDANFTTVADQLGKLRRSMVDGLGRLVRVDEPDGNNNLGTTASPVQPTSYDYDPAENLIKVIQGTQTRFFLYDSLARLIRARNPEQNTYGPISDITDPFTGNSAWSVKYEYDANGNLLRKTDPRGVTATYVYDALNRNTSVDYSDATADIERLYDLAINGKGRVHQVSQVGTTTSATYIDSYDALGRPLIQRQRYQTSGVWSAPYQTERAYNRAGLVTSQTYPSGRTVSYSYDSAGRTNSFSGNLGGSNRTYSTGIIYSSLGAINKEQFGTATPINNKLFYNSRGQLAEIRESTSYTGPTDTTWNRGAIINHYSDQCWGACTPTSSMTDNNGNLRKQDVYIPNNDQLPTTDYTMRWQQYDYDALNRLNWVREISEGGSELWKQQFTYDRWGNRTINTTTTYGTGINNKAFTVNTANNRLGVPAGQSGTMAYDSAGNLTNDTYTGVGNRVYDAENRMTQAWGGNNQLQYYTYNADGQRTRRKLDGTETWQIYGFDGELLAEYAANAATSSPKKEYGYRNGQLLITAEAQSSSNVAAASNGAVATASSTFSTFVAANAINGDHVGTSSYWADNTSFAYPDWILVDFAGSKTISEIDVYGLQQNPSNPTEPTLTMTSTYALTNFEVQYWTGSAWAVVPGGSVTGNDKVWRKFTFAPLTTSKIRVYVTNVAGDNRSQVVEVEAWGSEGSGSTSSIHWLVTDQLGTPRMIFDQTGSLANVKRHDYLPFGEELFAPVGGRTAAQGYGGGDGVRQKFTRYERDSESGLDYFLARHYSSIQGRFTSADEFTGGPDDLFDFPEDASGNPTFYAELENPQSIVKRGGPQARIHKCGCSTSVV